MPNIHDHVDAKYARLQGLSPVPDTFENLITDGSGTLLVKVINSNLSATINGIITANITNTIQAAITKSVVANFDHFKVSSITTTATQATSRSASVGVTVKAARTNAVRIFVGNSDVTPDTANSTDGMELGPGESLFLPVDNSNQIYIVAEAGSSAKAFIVVA